MTIVPVTKVGKTGQSGTEHRFESLAVLSGQGEVELEVMLDLLQCTQTLKTSSFRSDLRVLSLTSRSSSASGR